MRRCTLCNEVLDAGMVHAHENLVVAGWYDPEVPANEVRVVDPDTGGAKGQKPERMDLIPVFPLQELSRVYGYGAKKYDDSNWRLGYDWGLSYAALMRHLTQFWGGESYDQESRVHHLASVAFHAFALMEFDHEGIGKDTRWKSKKVSLAMGQSAPQSSTTTHENSSEISSYQPLAQDCSP